MLRLIKSLQKCDTSNSEFDSFLYEDFQINTNFIRCDLVTLDVKRLAN